MRLRHQIQVDLERFLSPFTVATSGSIAVAFALTLSVALLSAGLAIDYSEMLRARNSLQQIADSASLAGAAEARANLISNGFSENSKSKVLKAAEATAVMFFDTQSKDAGFTATATASVTYKQRAVKSTVTFDTTYKPHLMSLFGYTSIPINSTSVSETLPVPYIEVTLLVDTSGSMALGADKAGQDKLRNDIGCAFACHDGSPVGGYADAYDYALGHGIMLRYSAINEGILALIDEFDYLDPAGESIKAAIWSFDTTEKIQQAQTTNRYKLRSNLPTAPATSGETEGATHFNESIQHVIQTIGKGGDGSNPGHPIKLLIIATDGAQDPGRFWVSEPQYREDVAPFDMSFCSKLQSSGVKVGILHTPYLPMTYDWGYNATLGQPSQIDGPNTRADDIPIVLKKCAGPLYVEASNSQKIISGFVDILKSVATPRLTQ